MMKDNVPKTIVKVKTINIHTLTPGYSLHLCVFNAAEGNYIDNRSTVSSCSEMLVLSVFFTLRNCDTITVVFSL